MSKVLKSLAQFGFATLIENQKVGALVPPFGPALPRPGAACRAPLFAARPTPRGGTPREVCLPLAVRPAFTFKANEVRK